MGFIEEIIGVPGAIVEAVVDIPLSVAGQVVEGVGGLTGGFLSSIGVAEGAGDIGIEGTLASFALPLRLLDVLRRFFTSPAGRAVATGGGILSATELIRQSTALLASGLSEEEAVAQAAGGAHGHRPVLFTQVIAVMPDGTQVVRSRQRGTPFLMSRDFQIAKRVFRTIRKAHARLPSKTRRTSKSKQLADAATDRAIRSAMREDCPPKC